MLLYVKYVGIHGVLCRRDYAELGLDKWRDFQGVPPLKVCILRSPGVGLLTTLGTICNRYVTERKNVAATKPSFLTLYINITIISITIRPIQYYFTSLIHLSKSFFKSLHKPSIQVTEQARCPAHQLFNEYLYPREYFSLLMRPPLGPMVSLTILDP